MFTSIPSLDPVLQCLLPAFTEPSFQTHIEVLLGWVMCLGKRTEFGVFQAIQADTPLSRKALMRSRPARQDKDPGTADESLAGQHGCGSRFEGQAVPGE